MRAKPCGALAIVIAFGIQGAGPAFAQDNGRNSGKERGGWVPPCSLDGVNPVQHPEIFGNTAIARSYGFVRGRDGAWQVMPGCHR
jgi:hypothetical protein